MESDALRAAHTGAAVHWRDSYLLGNTFQVLELDVFFFNAGRIPSSKNFYSIMQTCVSNIKDNLE